MGKPTICIGENKGADHQLRGNREADQRLCFRYSYSTIPPLLNSKISSFWPASVAVQAGLCQTCSETTLLVFPRGGSIIVLTSLQMSFQYLTWFWNYSKSSIASVGSVFKYILGESVSQRNFLFAIIRNFPHAEC